MLRECGIVPAEDARGRPKNLDSYALPFAAFGLRGMSLTDLRPLTDLRHADVPPRVAGCPGIAIGDDGDDRGAIRAFGPLHRLAEIRKALNPPREGAHGLGVLCKVDRKRLLDPAI